MVKKVVVVVVAALFLVGMGLGYYLLTRKDRAESVEAVCAIPQNAQMVLKVNDFKHVGQLLSWLKADEAEAVYSTIKTHLPSGDDYLTEGKAPYLLVSSHPTENQLLSGVIYYLVFPAESMVSSFMQNLISGENPSDIRSNTSTSGYLQFDNNIKLYYEQVQRFTILSTSEELIEQSVRQWKEKESLENNPIFAEAIRTSGKHSAANLLIKGELLAGVSGMPFNSKVPGAANLFSQSETQSWLSLDVAISGNVSHFSGFWISNGQAVAGNPIFSGSSSDTDFLRKIPYTSSYAYVLKVGDLESLLSYYELYITGKEEQQKYLSNIMAVSDASGISVRDFIVSIAPQEVGTAYVQSVSSREKGWVTFLKPASLDVSLSMLKEHAEKGGLNPVKGAIGALLGGNFAENGETYYISSGSYLLFSDSKELLESVRQAKKSLQAYIDEDGLKPYIAYEAGLFGYINSESFNSAFCMGRLSLSGKLSFQLFELNGKVYCNAIASAKEVDWTSSMVSAVVPDELLDDSEMVLADTVERKPNTLSQALLFNKTVTVQSNTFTVQQNHAYTLSVSQKDKQLFTVNVGKPVANAEPCNFAGKGTYYWVYSTDSLIYMVDSNGKMAKGFPVKPPAEITNGVALFDYSNTLDYRIFVACADKKIYLYDKHGKPVEGWNTKQTEEVVVKPVRFFRLSNKDYLVLSDAKKVYILDRRGNDRVIPKEAVVTAPNSEFKGLTNPSRITCTDSDGRDVTIYLSDGKVERK